jgi:hypothetical protein
VELATAGTEAPAVIRRAAATSARLVVRDDLMPDMDYRLSFSDQLDTG